MSNQENKPAPPDGPERRSGGNGAGGDPGFNWKGLLWLSIALSLIATHDSDGKLWSNERLLQQLNTYHAARHQIRLDPEARNARHTHLSEDGLTIHQTLIDPDDLNDWSLRLTLDLEKSNETRTPAILLEGISPY